MFRPRDIESLHIAVHKNYEVRPYLDKADAPTDAIVCVKTMDELTMLLTVEEMDWLRAKILTVPVDPSDSEMDAAKNLWIAMKSKASHFAHIYEKRLEELQLQKILEKEAGGARAPKTDPKLKRAKFFIYHTAHLSDLKKTVIKKILDGKQSESSTIVVLGLIRDIVRRKETALFSRGELLEAALNNDVFTRKKKSPVESLMWLGTRTLIELGVLFPITFDDVPDPDDDLRDWAADTLDKVRRKVEGDSSSVREGLRDYGF